MRCCGGQARISNTIMAPNACALRIAPAAYRGDPAPADPSGAPSLAPELPYRRHRYRTLQHVSGEGRPSQTNAANTPKHHDATSIRCDDMDNAKSQSDAKNQQHMQAAQPKRCPSCNMILLPTRSSCRRARRGSDADNATQPPRLIRFPAMRGA